MTTGRLWLRLLASRQARLIRRTRVEKSDRRHHRLLRVCAERPRDRCAAETRNEVAPYHANFAIR
jgi:hypothetical protein